MKKTILSDFFTTVSFRQFITSIHLILFRLPNLRYGKNIKILEKQFLKYLNLKESKIVSVYNGRTALYQALRIIWVNQKDEVIISGYTCISVTNSVIQSWAKVIYSDIEGNTLWLDTKDLKKKITKNTKVIIIQHTFWKPSEIKKIIEIAEKNNILIIEDCAHCLWSKFKDKHLWSFGDFSIFSTGRDKVISSVTGGFIIVNNKKYFNSIESMRYNLIIPQRKKVIKDLNYNVFGYLSYKFYDFFSLWKVIIFITRKLDIINEILTTDEKNCNYLKLNYTLPNSLAILASKELSNINLYSTHRNLINSYYKNNIRNTLVKSIYKTINNEINNGFRYPMLIKNKDLKNKLYCYMRKNNVLLWKSWSWDNIVPEWVNNSKANYRIWECQVAEDISYRILTLPNHKQISIKDAKKVVTLINNFQK